MLRILSIIAIWLFTPGQPFSFPVFGTKRYHRASNIGIVPQSSSSLTSNPIVPYYNSLGQYYDEQPIYVQPQNYEYETNVNNDAYYYPTTYSKQRHEYHTYGMPTYHGEYKPTPYYYAPGPSYSYYDDREIPNNPLDDLHEEILQEDELERQRELYPVIGQENWYGSSKKQDAYTKNFLRNLIAYNRRMEAQQQQRQQQQLQQQQQQQQQEMQRDQENEYDDYMEMNPSEYDYDQVEENPYDLLSKYERQQSTKADNTDDMDDENVRQLKMLANSKQQQQQLENYNHNRNDKKFMNKNNNYNHKENNYQEDLSNWQEQLKSSNTFNQYDAEPEYEEEQDDWINWDRKRSDSQMKKNFLNDESIKAFTNRKPSSIVQHSDKTLIKEGSINKPLQKTIKLSELSSSETVLSSSPIPLTVSSSSSSLSSSLKTTTSKPTSDGKKSSGQKEIVLPRPATPTQHLFSQPVLDMLDRGKEFSQEQNNQQPEYPVMNSQQQQQQQQTNSYAIRPTEKQSKSDATTTENKRSKDSIKSNANIYDTIRELIAMEEQLGKQSSELNLKKRFVSNEDNLVRELDSLKRRSL